jgi:hypothetical protein
VLRPSEFIGEPIAMPVDGDLLTGKVVSYDAELRLWAHLVFNQPKSLLTVAVGLRPSQVVRSTALGVLFPDLQEYIAPRPRLCMSPRLLLFL